MPDPTPTTVAMKRALRGVILRALLELHPSPLLRRALQWIVSELEITNDQLDAEITYLREISYLSTEPVSVLGTQDLKIRLLPKGLSAAKSLDPESPVL